MNADMEKSPYCKSHSELTSLRAGPILSGTMLALFAHFFWIHLPAQVQVGASRFLAIFFRSRFSAHIISPYCRFFGLDAEALKRYQPSGENFEYESYSDFFKRKFKTAPKMQSDYVWPCQGYVCDWGWFKEKRKSAVKGTHIDLNSIFRTSKSETQEHFFTNIFLHNHNYHRIHSPCTLKIEEIMHVPGYLHFLRPWFYKRDQVSFPSIKNERTIIRFSDSKLNSWYLAFVGGFGVGTIELEPLTRVGAIFNSGQELGHFNLGSTICMASPYEIPISQYLQEVDIGHDLKLKHEDLKNARSFKNEFDSCGDLT